MSAKKLKKPTEPKLLKLPLVLPCDLVEAGDVCADFIGYIGGEIGKLEKRKRLTEEEREKLKALAGLRARLSRFNRYAATVGKNYHAVQGYKTRLALWKRQEGLPLTKDERILIAVEEGREASK